MKWRAIIVLAAIALSIVVPPSLPLLISGDAHASIGTLDVCHSATPALSSNGDMPCMNEPACHPAVISLFTSITPENKPLKPQSITFQDERPPRI